MPKGSPPQFKREGSRQTTEPEASATPPALSPSSPSEPVRCPIENPGDEGTFSPDPSMPKDPSRGQVTSDMLAIYAGALNELESTRKANFNRVGALERQGITEGPEIERLRALVDAIHVLEDQAVAELERAFKKHPFYPFMKSVRGLGSKQLARLLAATGDPYWNTLEDRPRRGPQELWAYCGLHVWNHDPSVADGLTRSVVGSEGGDTQQQIETRNRPGVAPRRRKGQMANWSHEAKMRAYLCAESCIKSGVRKIDPKLPEAPDEYFIENRKAITPLAQKYLDRRYRTLETHPEWTNNHRHTDALRVVSKEILKMLWVEGRRLAGEGA